MVGCVIVLNDKIIGEGFHKRCGEAHAEVNAINSVKNKKLLSKATLYVNLEPCAHHGKTPPCTNLILKHHISTIVIGSLDPNPLVSGKGAAILKKAGCKVKVGILKKECITLNKRFFVFHKKKRLYILLKWAQTADGFMDIERRKKSPEKYWITNDGLRILVHKWRTEEGAILIGTKTAYNDNPQLTVRYWKGKQPIRMVLDKDLTLPSSLHLFDQKNQTIVFTQKTKKDKRNITFITIDFTKDILKQLLKKAFDLNIQSIMVEGGSIILSSFIKQGLWDEARILVGDKVFKKGLKAPIIPTKKSNVTMIGTNKIISINNSSI